MEIGSLMLNMVLWLAGGVGVMILLIGAYLWFINANQMKGS